MNGWTDGLTDGRSNGRTDKVIAILPPLYEWGYNTNNYSSITYMLVDFRSKNNSWFYKEIRLDVGPSEMRENAIANSCKF